MSIHKKKELPRIYKYFTMDMGESLKDRVRGGIENALQDKGKSSKQFHAGVLLMSAEVFQVLVDVGSAFSVSQESMRIDDLDIEEELYVLSRKLAQEGGVEEEWDKDRKKSDEWLKGVQEETVTMQYDKEWKYRVFWAFIVKAFIKRSYEMKENKKKKLDAHLANFKAGELFAFRRILYLVREQAELAFQLPLEELGLAGMNPEKDLW